MDRRIDLPYGNHPFAGLTANSDGGELEIFPDSVQLAQHNQGGFDSTNIDLVELVRWLRADHPDVLEQILRLSRRIPKAKEALPQEGKGCRRCGKPLAYTGALYCGAACTAQAEAGRG